MRETKNITTRKKRATRLSHTTRSARVYLSLLSLSLSLSLSSVKVIDWGIKSPIKLVGLLERERAMHMKYIEACKGETT